MTDIKPEQIEIDALISWNDSGAMYWETNGDQARSILHRDTAQALRQLKRLREVT